MLPIGPSFESLIAFLGWNNSNPSSSWSMYVESSAAVCDLDRLALGSPWPCAQERPSTQAGVCLLLRGGDADLAFLLIGHRSHTTLDMVDV